MKGAAVFLDRDGTIIENRGYIGDPDDVALLPGSADALRRFSEAGFLVVITSNQSGIARGLFDEDDLDHVHEQMEELLEAQGASLDGAYYCPYLDGTAAKVKAFRRDSELRKPKPGMLLQAARELSIDLRRSWMIGDAATDVTAGHRAGCHTILLTNGASTDGDDDVEATHTATDLEEAANLILGVAPKRRQSAEASSSTEQSSAAQAEQLRVLEQIHDVLDRAHRTKRQDDFSLLRLGGALLQMFAIVAAVWGAYALFNEDATNATPRFLLACFLQLASLAAFAVDHFR